MAKTKVREPGGLEFAGATRRLVGAIPGAPEDGVSYEGGCSCGFRTSGWAKQKDAQGRIDQHLEEHSTGGETLPQELSDYKREVGFDVDVAVPPVLDPFGDGDNLVLSATDDAQER